MSIEKVILKCIKESIDQDRSRLKMLRRSCERVIDELGDKVDTDPYKREIEYCGIKIDCLDQLENRLDRNLEREMKKYFYNLKLEL